MPSSWTHASANLMELREAETFVLNPFSSLWFHVFMTLSGDAPLAHSAGTLPEITVHNTLESQDHEDSSHNNSADDGEPTEANPDHINDNIERPSKRRRITQATTRTNSTGGSSQRRADTSRSATRSMRTRK